MFWPAREPGTMALPSGARMSVDHGRDTPERQILSPSVRRMRAMVRAARRRVRACSHTRRTRQPLARRVRVTTRSRPRLVAIFLRQNLEFCLGIVPCFGQPCQKQPSTKSASLALGKTKSGLPNSGLLRRQPEIFAARKREMSLSSVARLPRPRIWDITSERLDFVNISGMQNVAVIGREHQPPSGFLRHVPKQPVENPAPRGIVRIQLLVGHFTRRGPPPRLGREALQHTRPAAVAVPKAVGMQPGKEVCDGRPCPDELFARQCFRRMGKRHPHFTAGTSQRVRNMGVCSHWAQASLGNPRLPGGTSVRACPGRSSERDGLHLAVERIDVP